MKSHLNWNPFKTEQAKSKPLSTIMEFCWPDQETFMLKHQLPNHKKKKKSSKSTITIMMIMMTWMFSENRVNDMHWIYDLCQIFYWNLLISLSENYVLFDLFVRDKIFLYLGNLSISFSQSSLKKLLEGNLEPKQN